MPLVAADFGSRSTIQLAVTLYLFSVAGGQLLHGRVSDKFGRRSTLLVSLGLYVAATAVAGWAAGITTLLIARIGQAVGGCGGLVLGRAIVRDSAAAGQAASRMALLTMVQSLAPGIGPAVGGFLGAWFGWRSIFAALVVLGVVTFGGVCWHYQRRRPRAASPARVACPAAIWPCCVPAPFAATCSAAPLPAPASTPL